MNILSLLQEWYLSNCDGDWEHGFGVRIGTIDNPGWYLKINLEGTRLSGKDFTAVEIERSEKDWLFCRVSGEMFEGYGGAANLEEILKIFLEWSAP